MNAGKQLVVGTVTDSFTPLLLSYFAILNVVVLPFTVILQKPFNGVQSRQYEVLVSQASINRPQSWILYSGLNVNRWAPLKLHLKLNVDISDSEPSMTNSTDVPKSDIL